MRGMLRFCAFAGALVLSMAGCSPDQPPEPTRLVVSGTSASRIHTPTSTLAAPPTSTATATPPPGSSTATTCRKSIDAMRALTHDLDVLEFLRLENPTETSDDFDVNSLLSALDHLTVTEGYTLDFVYYADWGYGFPLIYARAIDETPYATYSEFQAARGARGWEPAPPYQVGTINVLPEHEYDYLEFIETDDTPEGYLQFFMMAIEGDQFYLFWHGGYHDEMILCDVSDLPKPAEPPLGIGSEQLENVIAQAQALALEPTVNLDEQTATVRFVLFTAWGGFIEVWYTLTRELPHVLVDAGSKVLIGYDWGVVF